MDYSGTISTRNPMTTWGDGGKREGKDDDSVKKPRFLVARFRVVIVKEGHEQEGHDTDSAGSA